MSDVFLANERDYWVELSKYCWSTCQKSCTETVLWYTLATNQSSHGKPYNIVYHKTISEFDNIPAAQIQTCTHISISSTIQVTYTTFDLLS